MDNLFIVQVSINHFIRITNIGICNFFQTTKRKGWINHGIEGPESIADHMYRMSLMALIVDDLPGVNRERFVALQEKITVRISLFHFFSQLHVLRNGLRLQIS